MRTSDCDILMVPGRTNSGPNHWQSRWQEKLPTARRVEQVNWEHVDLQDWSKELAAAVTAATRPVVLVAHSAGVNLVAHAAPHLPGGMVRGAFLVAPAGSRFVLEHEAYDMKLAHPPQNPLPFPATVIASHSDPYCPILEAEEWAYAWGAAFSDAGDAGHINTDSGHGPWPEGLMRFAGFLQKLNA